MQFKLTGQQDIALNNAFDFFLNADSRGYVLAGPAGTGKTTIIQELSTHLMQLGCDYKVVTPTGKASSVLKGKGVDATTIHALMYKPDLDEDGNLIRFEKQETMIADAIIMDEASMLSRPIFNDIMGYNIPILYVGDFWQLPAVSMDGDDFNIMSVPDYELSEVLRTSLSNPITALATDVRKTGKFAAAKYKGKSQVRFLDTNVTKHLLMDNHFDIMLCATNRKRNSLNSLARVAKGYHTEMPVEGETIMCLKNGFYSGTRIFNGERFTIIRVGTASTLSTVKDGYKQAISYSIRSLDRPSLEIHNIQIPNGCWDEVQSPNERFHDRTVGFFTFGYAVTVHKAQGSEYKNVLFLDEKVNGWDRKRFRYTGVTRATDHITIVGG